MSNRKTNPKTVLWEGESSREPTNPMFVAVSTGPISTQRVAQAFCLRKTKPLAWANRQDVEQQNNPGSPTAPAYSQIGLGIASAFLVVALLLVLPVVSSHAAAPPPVYAEHGMVVSASEHASEVGVEILEAGGNAFDAAAAAGFVLAVTYPQAGNIGGGGFLVAHTADGETLTLDFRETAPANAARNMFLDEDGEPSSELSLRSHLASGTPGSVDGLLRIWRDHGSGNISRRALLRPAIRLADEGFILTRVFAAHLNDNNEFFQRNDAASDIFIRKDGRPWQAGDRFVQKDLARALRRIARDGRPGFYEGKTAELLVAEMNRGGGLISHEDLRSYTSKYREPVTGSYGDYQILGMGPPSSGGILVVQMLNMLEPYDLAALGWHSSDYVHVLTEVERRAYADRATHLGDADFWDVPIATLVSKDYAQKRAADISMTKATPSSEISAGEIPQAESRQTTHYSIVDADRNAVAVTTTLNASFGSGIMVEGAGFFLNNEMDDFSAKPGEPNLYGLIGGEANAIEPGKRMLSSMAPTIVVKDNAPFLVLGTPGGSTIITTVLQIVLNVAEHGMDIQEAVAAPRVHHQWLPDEIVAEPRALVQDVVERLRAMGHTVKPGARDAIGQANCIAVSNGAIFGAPDPRGENAAVGY